MKKTVNEPPMIFLLVFAIFWGSVFTPVFDDLSYFFHTLGSYNEKKTYTMNGVLKKARKLDRDLYGFDLDMFPKNKEVYYIEVSKYDRGEELVWGWYVSLPESPELHIGESIALKYNFIRNWLGNEVDVQGRGIDLPLLRTYMGIPIYGKITVSTALH
ncbi:MAG: hypothetical protein HZB99_00340 [Candidatus Harrisonbacteria bacterium]|nr:hypothetical protein [Candidatus Harrisonbacteria bacterium]